MNDHDRSPLLALGALTLVAALGFEHIFGSDHSYRPVVYGAAVLPVPVLDGGQVVFQLAEMAKGAPLSMEAQVIGQKIGIALLVVLMGFAFYNDLSRLFG